MDKYKLADEIRKSYLKHGKDSWVSIANDMLSLFYIVEKQKPKKIFQERAKYVPKGTEDCPVVKLKSNILSRDIPMGKGLMNQIEKEALVTTFPINIEEFTKLLKQFIKKVNGTKD